MNNLGKDYLASFFSHIYIEKECYQYPNTKQILNAFPNAKLIELHHYKDVFNRTHQSFCHQKQAPNLILAVKKDNLVYEGAKVCQDFGNQHFYYTSNVMNCIFDCEYCYLQGMYPSANLVVFVNLEDVFAKVKSLLKEHSVYLCISYDTDLLAMEGFLHYVKQWIDFSKDLPNLTIELRTKSANSLALREMLPHERFIIAFTLSPEQVIQSFEHHTPSLSARIKTINEVLALGFPVRLCFDPVLKVPNWDTIYKDMLETVFTHIPAKKVKDVSIGLFRISSDYMKQMRKMRPASVIIQYPYQNENGVFFVGKKDGTHMIEFMKQQLVKYIAENKLFIWKE